MITSKHMAYKIQYHYREAGWLLPSTAVYQTEQEARLLAKLKMSESQHDYTMLVDFDVSVDFIDDYKIVEA